MGRIGGPGTASRADAVRPEEPEVGSGDQEAGGAGLASDPVLRSDERGVPEGYVRI